MIRSILFSEYYKRNNAPNTQHILALLKSEINVTKGISLFCSNWINDTLSETDILLQKINVPNHPDFIRSIEQRVNDLLEDNDAHRKISKHSVLDKHLKLIVNKKWVNDINETVLLSHLGRPPDIEADVARNMIRCGFISTQKIDSLLALAGIVEINNC